MLTLDELSERVSAYSAGSLSFAEFENWFEDNSAGAYDVADLRNTCIAVDAALSQYHFDGIEESALKAELTKATCAVAPATPAVAVAALELTEIYFDCRMESGNDNSYHDVGPSAQTVGSNSALGFTRA
jgi:hypothetical protein